MDPKSPIIKMLALDQIMSWCQIDNNTFLELMMVLFGDVYIRQWVKWTY